MRVAEAGYDLERAASDFERGWPADLADFLPERSSPKYLTALVELARVDMELAFSAGSPRAAADYIERFPELATDESVAQSLAFEEDRLRRQAGQPIDQAAEQFRRSRQSTAVGGQTDRVAAPEQEAATQLFEELHEASPHDAARLAEAITSFPDVGGYFLGYHLIGELGRGAFSRVYLAREPAVGNRLIALKITGDARAEIGALARLRHTHIAPVYSVQQHDPHEAIVMPYLGSVTLADVIRELRKGPRRGRALVTALSIPEPLSPRWVEVQRQPWPEVALRLAKRMAAGLAHAHERGILHRDLKPANVLITDDGEPLLLDFNLAEESTIPRGPGHAIVGGTLPYMAPEQLAQFTGGASQSDARADVYSFGLVLFELLTGQPPVPTPRTSLREVAHLLYDLRQQPVPNVRSRAADVSPAFAAIVARCLERDPGRRYANAIELHDDLERQSRDLPLRHAAEPSVRERFAKWRRRHPRLSSAGGVASLATVALLALGTLAWHWQSDRARLMTLDQARLFRQELLQAQLLLAHPTPDTRQREAGLAIARQAWDRAPATGEPLTIERGTLAYLAARGEQLAGRGAEASDWNGKAQALLGPAAVAQAEAWAAPGPLPELRWQYPGQNGAGDYLAGLELFARGQLRAAADRLRAATDADPGAIATWYARGLAESEAGRHRDATASFSTILALDNQIAEAWHARGNSRFALGESALALRDLSESLRRVPTAAAHFDRARILQSTGDLKSALADLDAAIGFVDSARFRVARSRVRDKLGDKTGAADDMRWVATTEPADEADWLSRVATRTQPELALADIEACLRSHPDSWQAYLAKASVLSEQRQDGRGSIAALSEAIRRRPGDATLLASRGVLHARLKEFARARLDAEAAVALDASPAVTYQVAGIYALTAADRPADRDRAVYLLGKSIHRGYGLQWFDHDPEMAPLRTVSEVKQLIRAARAENAPGG